jgi:antitoxin ParD1/3/4
MSSSVETKVETITVAVPVRIAAIAQRAVDTGEYASVSDVVSEALMDWSQERVPHANSIEDLREAWGHAVENRKPGVLAEEVLGRLEKKYQAMADATGR